MRKVTVVVGGQYGSEGKGAVCGRLHQEYNYKSGIRVGGSNAGHTVYDSANFGFALRHIPVAAAVDPHCKLLVAPGSELDLPVLMDEVAQLELTGHEVSHRLWVHEAATLVTEEHYAQEGGLENGSTKKGVGAARAARALRQAPLVRDSTDEWLLAHTYGGPWDEQSCLIEGTQGYGLGSHAGDYPHCTSGDCRAIDFMAQAGIHPFVHGLEVWVVLRTYPIRIAGNSGPLYRETNWSDVGVAPEFTTVTKKERRVGYWSTDQARAAVQANGGYRCKVALTFADYWWPELGGVSYMNEVESGLKNSVLRQVDELGLAIGAPIELIGTGPRTHIPLGRTAEEWADRRRVD